jgi:hypothetical protein
MHSTAILLGMSVLLSSGATFVRVGVRVGPPQAEPKQEPPKNSIPKQVVLPPPGDAKSQEAAPKGEKEKAPFKPEELEQLLAPVALHPDDLLSQILMAATYPVEVVQAERWLKANPKLTGDALAKELEKQTWDPSVRSLVNCPQVLTMMSEKLDWTVNLGNAFIGQQKEVMDTIQKMRAKAQEAGNLKSSKEQKVSTEKEEGKEVIVIEQSDPQVIYVPTYNPTVIYGSWPYPAYPPYYWYPPAYVPPPYPAFHFGVGVAVGVAWGYAWGNCNWGGSDVDIDVNRNTEFNRNIDRGSHAQQLDRNGTNKGKGNFKHDPSHRQGVSYRDNATSKKFGGPTASDRSASRDSFRGKDSAAPKASDRAAGAGNKAGAGDRAGAGNKPSASDRSAGSSGSRGNAAADRGGSAKSRSNAFEGAKQGGSSARAASDRGRSSRSSSPSAGARSRGGGGGRRGR